MAESVQRRLAAILAADVVGYTRMMSEDEEGTLQRLKSLRADVFDPVTAGHQGRIFKTIGDGVLAEFTSAVRAVQCAVEIQRELKTRNARLPESHRIALRIGISLGDVMIEGDDLYGNGVNIAARLEGLAEAGSICISGNVHEHVGKALNVAYLDLGEQSVKNIDRPIRTYRVVFEGAGSGEAPSKAWQSIRPQKPSIAVLPFQNMSGDPEQEYFSDGIAEDIITGLSRIRQFLVIARNTTFTYKGKPLDIQEIAGELGVRYVLEGSVRKAGARVRITAQLIDGETRSHIWAERYDRELEDIFAVQDEITEKIVGVVGPEVMQAEIQRSTQGRSDSIQAWDGYLRGLACLRENTKKKCAEARDHFNGAVALDPTFSAAYARLATCCTNAVYAGWSDAPESELIAEAFVHAEQALAADRAEALAYDSLASAHQLSGNFEEAIRMARKAVELLPTCAAAYGTLVTSLAFMGEAKEAEDVYLESQQVSPRDPERSGVVMGIAMAYFISGQYEKSVLASVDHAILRPNWYGNQVYLAAAAAKLGNVDQAQKAVEKLLTFLPGLTVDKMRQRTRLRQPGDIAHLIDALTLAGLPAE